MRFIFNACNSRSFRIEMAAGNLKISKMKITFFFGETKENVFYVVVGVDETMFIIVLFI